MSKFIQTPVIFVSLGARCVGKVWEWRVGEVWECRGG